MLRLDFQPRHYDRGDSTRASLSYLKDYSLGYIGSSVGPDQRRQYDHAHSSVQKLTFRAGDTAMASTEAKPTLLNDAWFRFRAFGLRARRQINETISGRAVIRHMRGESLDTAPVI